MNATALIHKRGRPRTRVTLYAVVAGNINHPLGYSETRSGANTKLSEERKRLGKDVPLRVVRVNGRFSNLRG